MHHFHPLTISKLIKETDDCVSLEFDIPDANKSLFEHKQGQHVTLRKIINEEDVRRSYSICTSPKENKLKVAIKKIANGAFSTYANEVLTAGDVLEVMPPSGSFNTELNPTQAKNYVGFAGGSGITPIISIMKAVMDTESQSTFTLVYANRSTDSMVFKEEIEGLKNKYINRLNIIHIFSQEHIGIPLFEGRIDQKKVHALNKNVVDLKSADEIFICGPEAMMLAIQSALIDLDIDKSKIHMELFTSPVGKLGKSEHSIKETYEEVKAKITIQIDGVKMDFDYSSNDSILDAAAKKGADLPYACKGGVCCTCKAKVIEGKVDMAINYALEQDEIERGYILSCQARPKTDRIILSFDEN
ncbi:phenylacetate-CoA oxygenase/reductase subunit PaaK [Reichenbachiella carrageenanivorans]|uniref:Phenylacetate-CoA oxygenase/reductase subunit PaaK n=1 Tax=Reichenbachiella carrageenanivorans TaxID=2979869 RepID=A0ABY6CY64_9BACT|nr:1,2-phenylacetyl-CoA epoxidase subunit PaaE [Reichenbachiella carrageenanivorans]UXX78856.1 phenylacetate-CoA oxygenase/reductase subunit PaaK [Reichenbachiella carrageenanivorans]